MDVNQQNARDVADLIRRLMLAYIGMSMGAFALFEEPDFDAVLKAMDFDIEPGDVVALQRKDGTWFRPDVDFRVAVDSVRSDLDLRIEFADALIVGIVTKVGDRMSKTELYTAFLSPETEFLRHIRNALAHGTRFHFARSKRGQEPIHPASFKGFTLHSGLHGTPLFDFIWPADLMELLEGIASHLRSV